MSRMDELKSRRRALLARCELQRAEMAVRVGDFKSDPLRRMLAGLLGGTGESRGAAALKHPLTWVVGIAALVFLRRPRQMLAMLGWARSALSMASKASVAMRLFAQFRGAFSRRPRGDDAPL